MGEGIREGKETAILIKSLFLEIKIYMANYRRAHNRLREQNQTKDIDRIPTDVFCFVLSATAEVVCPLGRLCRFARFGYYAKSLPKSAWLISFSSILATPLSAS